jgi:hypothetical protein
MLESKGRPEAAGRLGDLQVREMGTVKDSEKGSESYIC